jgi:hypothetical protein
MIMKHKSCENEVRILEALGQGVAPEAFEEPLRQHVANCAWCAEIISVYELFQSDSKQLCATAPVPEAGHVWWRATLAARRAAAERALRPILIAERVALGVGCGTLIALLIFAAPWLAKQLPHTKIFSGAVVYTFPLSSLLVAGVIVCLLLMAGALYTVWAEK